MTIVSIKESYEEAKATGKTVTMLLLIPVTVLSINVLGMLCGGLLGPAILAGVVFTFSFCFILWNMGMKRMLIVRDFVSSYAGWLDLAQTLFLTWLGFHLGGVIMGLTFMALGLDLSACFSLLRLWSVLTNDKQRKIYDEEMCAA